MPWIDTHCHLDAAEFALDRSEVRERARRAGVTHCVIPAVRAQDFEAVRRLAHAQHDVYALGIHPLFTPNADEHDVAQLDASTLRALTTLQHKTIRIAPLVITRQAGHIDGVTVLTDAQGLFASDA